jgi:hypothetical protein
MVKDFMNKILLLSAQNPGTVQEEIELRALHAIETAEGDLSSQGRRIRLPLES